jgi:Shedu protein SduA, C-terminal
MLRERVEDFIANGSDAAELDALLNECVADGTLEGLACARRLYESDYGGLTFNWELKAPAASALVMWGQAGIQALVEGAQRYPSYKNISLCAQLLASLAAGHALLPLSFVRDSALAAKIEASRSAQPGLVELCRGCLVDLVLSIESDDDVAYRIAGAISNLSVSDVSAAAAKELFAALSARWLAVSKPVTERYEALLVEQPDNEAAFQRFLTDHPQLLDPMAVQVWPQPDLFGYRFPDFMVRRADNSYIVIEIERPSRPLVTAGGQLSADVTHAEQQATDYRSYLMQRPADARVHFPNFEDPDCLVVTGLERALDARQTTVLREANRNRHRLRIVGFDWLANRARTVAENMTRHHVEVVKVRMT